MNPRILVIGASGLVGTALSFRARTRMQMVGAARTLNGFATRALDWTNPHAVRALCAEVQPSHVAVCAAWPHVDGCEADPARSRRENVDTLKNLLAAISSDTRVLFFSTDHVFDGSKPFNVERDPVHPLSVYARHKLEAEQLLLGRGRSLIVRTAWVFGPEPRRKNFVYRVIDSARRKQPLVVPEKQAGCPTSAEWLAENALNLFLSGEEGVVHLAGQDCLTKAEWATTIAEALELKGLEVKERPWREAGQVAPRPVRVKLQSERHGLTQPSAASILRAQKGAILSA